MSAIRTKSFTHLTYNLFIQCKLIYRGVGFWIVKTWPLYSNSLQIRLSTYWKREVWIKTCHKIGESQRISHIISDTRINYLPLTSPLSVILVLTSYVYFVYRIGPAYMSKRKPFSLKEVIITYDLLQIILNLALLFYVNIDFFCDRQSST